MSSLREIRKRIQSVHNIKQITKAMEMVAGSRLHRAEVAVKHSRLFLDKMRGTLDHLILSGADLSHPLMVKREQKRVALVVVSADRGLCGAYHSHLFAATDRFLAASKTRAVDLILLGRKAIGHYTAPQYHSSLQLPDWGGKITGAEVEDLSNNLVNAFLTGEYDAVWVIYTRFKTIWSRDVITEQLLNVEVSNPNLPPLDYILEPSGERVLADILPRWCRAKMRNYFDEAYASELSARLMSMKTATKNAGEMIESLTLIRNKLRQESITEELTEIVTGAEGLR